jgi:magnesium transporter
MERFHQRDSSTGSADRLAREMVDDPHPRHRGHTGPLVCIENDSLDKISEARGGDGFIWLNLRGATKEEIQKAGDALGLHPLTIEDLQEFDQRAKVEEYGHYVYIVTYGATTEAHDQDSLNEIHIVYAPEYLLTVAAETSPTLMKMHESIGDKATGGHVLLHEVLDRLVDSYGPLLDRFDREIEELEEKVVERDLRGRELEIHKLRRRLGRVNRAVHRELESFTRLPEALRRMPDHNPDDAPYFRDVRDHLISVGESADAMRERVDSLFELYMAALDNRQNIVMKQFTVIAGIFLPLSVVTGFFGMNFGWMVTHIESQTDFLLLGVAVPLVVAGGLIAVIAARGLFRE